MDEITSLRKKNGETLDASEWNKFISVINYIIDFYNHYPTKLSEFENDIVDLFIGPKGDKGDKGDTGALGPQGELGPKGADGVVTFEELTEEQRESLRGPLGIQGIQGILGEQGPAGQDGTNGTDGQDGHTPLITASKSNGVTTISVDGTIIATINDGVNGLNGADAVLPELATVATSGSYADLSNKPTIPTIWRGTQAEYDLLTPDDNTIYIITSAS